MNLLSIVANQRKPAAHLLILILLAFAVLALPAGLWDLRGPDEGRYTQIAKELLHSDNWFALRVMGKPYDQKPPLAFWMFAGTLKMTGGEPASWALRLPSAIAAILTLLLTYAIGRRFAGARAGLWSGLFLLTSIAFMDDAPTVELNMLYTFFTTATLAVWLLNFDVERLSWVNWAVFWLMLAAAFMVKGPLAVLIVVSALGYTAWSVKSWQPFRAVRFVPGFLLLLAIIGAWLLAQRLSYGSDFVEKQVTEETVDRFIKGDHGEPIWYYFPRIFTAALGPWAFIFIAALVAMWRQRGKNESYKAPLIGWMALPFVVLLLANGKRVPYLLPLLPAACILSGIWAERWLAHRELRSIYSRLLAGVVIAFAVALVAVGAVLFFPDRLFSDPSIHKIVDFERLYPVAWLVSGGLMGALALAFVWSRKTWAEGFWALGLAILLLQLMDFAIVRPALDPGKSTRQFAQHIEKLIKTSGEDTILTLPELGEPEFHVYGDYQVRIGRKADIRLSEPKLPRVLALKSQEIKTSGTEALAAGYKEVFDLEVTKKTVRIYLRSDTLSASN